MHSHDLYYTRKVQQIERIFIWKFQFNYQKNELVLQSISIIDFDYNWRLFSSRWLKSSAIRDLTKTYEYDTTFSKTNDIIIEKKWVTETHQGWI